MQQKQPKHIIDILFVIALFCLFALSAIFLISIGADIYGKTVNNMESNFDARTALAYVTEKIRQSDQKDQITIGKLDDCQALIITSQSADSVYYTYLYEYDGQLKELMVRVPSLKSMSTVWPSKAITRFTMGLPSRKLAFRRITISPG